MLDVVKVTWNGTTIIDHSDWTASGGYTYPISNIGGVITIDPLYPDTSGYFEVITYNWMAW